MVTAAFLYLPTSFLVCRQVVREHRPSLFTVGAVALLAGVPMYIHGYLIVFRGSRFF